MIDFKQTLCSELMETQKQLRDGAFNLVTGTVTCTSHSNAGLSKGGMNRTFTELLFFARLCTEHLNILFNLNSIAILRSSYDSVTFTDEETQS